MQFWTRRRGRGGDFLICLRLRRTIFSKPGWDAALKRCVLRAAKQFLSEEEQSFGRSIEVVLRFCELRVTTVTPQSLHTH